MPAGFPPWPEVETALRAAIGRLLPIEWLAYFEYHAAWRACSQGDGAEMQQAAARLEDLATRAPDLAYQRPQRLLVLADLQRALGEFGRALATVDQVQQELGTDPTGREALHANLLGLRSEILRETGRLEEAAAAMQRALPLALAAGDATSIERAVVRDQALALATGRFADSCAAIEELLDQLAADHPARAMLLLCLGHAQSGLAGDNRERLHEAAATLAQARTLARGHVRVRADLKRLDLALRAGDVAAATAAAADCTASLGPAASALPPTRDAVEFLGLQARLLVLREADADDLRAWLPRQAAAEAELAREWRTQPAGTGGIGFLHLTQRRDLLAAGIALRLLLADHEDRPDGPAAALQVLLDLQLQTSLARHRAAAPCTVADLQAQLAGDHGVLVFLPARSATWTFLVGRTDVQCERLAGDLPVDPALTGLATALARSPTLVGTAREHALAELAQHAAVVRDRLLPGPLLARIHGLRALTVVGADLLGGVVVEALPLADGRLLGEAIAVDSIGSLPLMLTLARRHRPQPRRTARALVLGCTIPAFRFPAEVLADAMTAYGGSDGIYDGDLTLERWHGLDLGTPSVVHVIAHGLPATDLTSGPGLQLADGPLWRTDVATAPRGTVVVSACGGGAGPVRPGEGEAFGSMVGAFLWHGATAVIASRRGLQAMDHLRLMAHCHRELAAGASPAAAMGAARAAMAGDGDLLARAQRAQVQVFGAGQLPPISR